jgi:hypothetical protein
MSLINEALRRAEEDKLGKDGSCQPVGDLSPVYGKITRRARPPRVSPRVLIVLALTLAGSSFLWGLLKCVGIVPRLPLLVQAEPAAASAQAGRPVLSAEAQAAFAKTIDAVMYHNPGERRTSPPSRPADRAATEELSEAPDAPAAGPAEGENPEKPSPDSRPAEPRTRQRDLADYKVNGIMCSSVDATAIINGHLVRVGDTVGDAKVVGIRPESVEMEIGGSRFLLRL